jgi:hypothetical protein
MRRVTYGGNEYAIIEEPKSRDDAAAAAAALRCCGVQGSLAPYTANMVGGTLLLLNNGENAWLAPGTAPSACQYVVKSGSILNGFSGSCAALRLGVVEFACNGPPP